MNAPFPYFGGKSSVAHLIWEALGDVKNYVEPFFGSGAVLLARPHGAGDVETVNDMDGLLANFWRAIAADPDAVAHHADWPVNECDLHARHLWLVNERENVSLRLMADPSWFDAKIAGWWVWGACSWIGSGWCSGEGPWVAVDGVLTKGNSGQGINKQLPRLSGGQGINKKLPHLSGGRGDFIKKWFGELSDRLRGVRVASGDWSRVCGPSVTWGHGLTGVFLDPPYQPQGGRSDVYAHESNAQAEVQAWCLENGKRDDMRIVLAGYEGEYDLPDWRCVPWKASGGYGSQGQDRGRENATLERLWMSPACVYEKKQGDLFQSA